MVFLDMFSIEVFIGMLHLCMIRVLGCIFFMLVIVGYVLSVCECEDKAQCSLAERKVL